jgi:hypothetical protein
VLLSEWVFDIIPFWLYAEVFQMVLPLYGGYQISAQDAEESHKHLSFGCALHGSLVSSTHHFYNITQGPEGEMTCGMAPAHFRLRASQNANCANTATHKVSGRY